MLLLASYWFYMSWNHLPFGLLLAGSTVLDYVAAIQISRAERLQVRRLWLLASCLGNLGVLAFFKYGEFIAENLWTFMPRDVAFPDFLSTVVLPVGISFYTFQSLSYLHNAGLVDKNRVMVLRTASNYTLPPPGKTAVANLLEEQHDSYAGLDAALENAYLVGSAVVDELLANWTKYRDKVPAPESKAY